MQAQSLMALTEEVNLKDVLCIGATGCNRTMI